MHQLMVVFIFLAVLISALYFAIIIYYRFAYIAMPIFYTTNHIRLSNPSTLNHQPSTFNLQPLNPSTKLSIIIPARNEAENIEACLQSILQNNYPAQLFEIIVVDDHSDDDTTTIVRKFSSQNVKLILLKDYVTDKINSYKKKAIEIAIAQATGTLIITTDADCIVLPTWLETIASFYEKTNAKFIAAPVLIETAYPTQTHTNKENLNSIDFGHPSPIGEGKGVRLFQSLDFMALQGITAAVVHKNQMTMCNGANMAYEREAFYNVGGFAGIDNIASGDDMLLMHKIYKQYPNRVMYLKSAQAVVQTQAVNSVKEFLNQRIRWASKADKYDDKRILPVLLVVYFFNVMMFSLPIVAVFTSSTISILNTQY
jgi:cellulose synthase/poly-beta-1,6-N-acetylglucosamine synthase-like glycosyltransferase